MGYCTRHWLDIFDNRSNLSDEEVKKLTVEKLTELNIIEDALTKDLDCYMETTWYNSTEDMIKLSREIPDVVFCLNGEGEDHDDMWRQYYLNGKVQHVSAIITFEEFDESKLK